MQGYYFLTKEDRKRYTKYCVSLDNKSWEEIPEHHYTTLLVTGEIVNSHSAYNLKGSLEWTTYKVKGVLPDCYRKQLEKPTPKLSDMDYAIMFVEEQYGNGAVMAMLDYIEDRVKEEKDVH